MLNLIFIYSLTFKFKLLSYRRRYGHFICKSFERSPTAKRADYEARIFSNNLNP
jgi:hypothetical protein